MEEGKVVSNRSLAQSTSSGETLTEEQLENLGITLYPYYSGILIRVNKTIRGKSLVRFYGTNWSASLSPALLRGKLFPNEEIARISVSVKLGKGTIL